MLIWLRYSSRSKLLAKKVSREIQKATVFRLNFLRPSSVKYNNNILWLGKISIQQLSKLLSGLSIENRRPRTQFQHHYWNNSWAILPRHPPAVAKFVVPTFFSKRKQNLICTSHVALVFSYTLVFFHILPYHGKHAVEAQRTLSSSPDRAVRSLAEDIVLCFWVRHFTLTVPLSTQVYKWVYKWVPVNFMLGDTKHCDRQASLPEGSRNTPGPGCSKAG